MSIQPEQPTSSASKRSSSKGERRQAVILERLARGESVTVNGLAAELGVSVATVRRDLSALEEGDQIARTYGGAALLRPPLEKTLGERELVNPAAKAAIAQKAATMVTDGDLIILDAGSTTGALAKELHGRAVSVVTNGLRILDTLVSSQPTQVLVLGGLMRGFNGTITGPDAEDMLRRVFAQTAFIGADAVDPVRGVGCRSYEQSRLKSQMMRHAEHVVVLADSSKLEDTAYPHWSPLPAHWTLVTDTATPSQHDALRAAGADLIPTSPREDLPQ